MLVTPEMIGGELVPPRLPGPGEAEQWQLWVDDVLLLIRLRCERLGVDVDSLDPQVVAFVVRRTVAAHAQAPDDAAQVSETVSIDDGSRTRSRMYRAASGGLEPSESMWALLGLAGTAEAGAFSTTPGFDPGVGRHPSWCDCPVCTGAVPGILWPSDARALAAQQWWPGC